MLLDRKPDLDAGPVVGTIQAARSSGRDRFLSPLLVATVGAGLGAFRPAGGGTTSDENPRAEVVSRLLEARADVNCSVLGVSPLLCACHSADNELLQVLISESGIRRCKAWSAASVFATLHGREHDALHKL